MIIQVSRVFESTKVSAGRVRGRVSLSLCGSQNRMMDEAVTREEFDMIAMAWRSLYAETVKARMDDKTLNMKRALWTWARLTLSRVKAYGNQWYKWYVKQRLWQQKKMKTIPEQYRKYILIEFGPQGDYYISSGLRKLFTDSRDA